jgi:hypothetical protein
MAELDLQPRGTTDWLDALVSLRLLERSGDEYANTAGTDLFLDRKKPSFVGGMLEMANARLYPFWGSLTDALRTGHPQNEARVGENFFSALYQDPDRLRQIPVLHDRPQHGCRGGHRREDPVGSSRAGCDKVPLPPSERNWVIAPGLPRSGAGERHADRHQIGAATTPPPDGANGRSTAALLPTSR